MPSPAGRPEETVRPEVSECSRMPDSRRPLISATTPWAPSCAIVTALRVIRPSAGERTSRAATAAAPNNTDVAGSGTTAVTRSQNRSRSTGRLPVVGRRCEQVLQTGQLEEAGGGARRLNQQAQQPAGVGGSRLGLQEQPDTRAGEVGDPPQVQGDVAGRH